MIERLQQLGDDASLLAELTRELAASGRWHELFEARLLEARKRLELPMHVNQSLDELPDPLRGQLEAAYTDACREVGQLLLDANRFREAWQYLRAAGEKPLARRALGKAVPRDETIDELVEVALYEQVDVERGFGWLLGHLGVCNAVTTLEGMAASLAPGDLSACATALVRRLHADLTETLRAVIAQRGDTYPPGGTPIDELLMGREWLFADDAYHIDTSHLAATVRLARVVTERAVIDLAAQLANYGKHLPADMQYASDPPFEGYEAYELFYGAQLGRQIDEAVEYFTRQADEHDIEQSGMAATEALLVLLDRLGRSADALQIVAERVPQRAKLSPYAPTALSLAQRSGDWATYEQLVNRHDDPVAYVLGRLARQQ